MKHFENDLRQPFFGINNNTLFSIIMPCFNSQIYIRSAINSVLHQSYINFELLLIDDGSTDDTFNILINYANRDKRVRVFHKENGGYPTAINYALDRINGDYFLMMGSDDELCYDLLENAVKTINRANPDMLVYKVRMHWIDDNSIDEIDPATLFEKAIDYQGNYADFYNENKYEACYFGLRDTGKIYKRKCLGDLRYFGHYGFDADGIFALLFAHRCHSFSVMPVEGYIWMLHKDSLSGRNLSIQTHLDRLSNWTNLVKKLKKIPKGELAGIDYSYSTAGHNIACYFGSCAKRVFLRNYFKIYRYYFHLRTFCLRKSSIKRYGKSLILSAYFPFTFFFLRTIKRLIKKRKH